jgi:hypothetical protein
VNARAHARSRALSCGLAAVVAVCLLGAEARAQSARGAKAEQSKESAEARRKRAAAAFTPFDAGATRAVARQGTKGKPRPAHPHVGDADKVPGEGPPPPPLRMDPDIPETAVDKPNAVTGLSANPLYLAALVYSNVLTKLDGPRCGHLPTCSRFASQAVARHGAVGILMGLERLQQPSESSAIRKLPEIEGYGGVRGFDPVENYEFWKNERFTGFPPPTKEEPLALPPLPHSAKTTKKTPR